MPCSRLLRVLDSMIVSLVSCIDENVEEVLPVHYDLLIRADSHAFPKKRKPNLKRLASFQ